LPEVFVEIVQYHHQPDLAPTQGSVAAAVQVADLLVQHAEIGYSGRCPLKKGEERFRECTGWKMLFGHQNKDEQALSQASLKHSLERVPATLEGLV
jgi:hypothetical protein